MNKIICLYGLPACGKTTQADLIVKKFGLIQFGMGDRLRAEIASGSELGQKIKYDVDNGLLIKDELMAEVIKSVGAEIKEKGIIFDGFPRMISQAEMLEKISAGIGMEVNAFFYLKVTPEEAQKRLILRSEGGGRVDDKDPEAVKNRFNVFMKESAPLLEHYAKQNKLIEIDGELPIEKVYEEIIKYLK